MGLRYDFDIHWVFPKELLDDPRLGVFDTEAGLNPEMRANYVALFRDPETVRALLGADQAVRDYFRTSGFGFSTHDSGAPDGFYPEGNDAAHVDVIERLTENLAGFQSDLHEMGAFDFEAFLAHLAEAEPIAMESLPETAAESPVPRARLPWRPAVGAVAAVVLAAVVWQAGQWMGIGPFRSGEFDTSLVHPLPRSGE